MGFQHSAENKKHQFIHCASAEEEYNRFDTSKGFEDGNMTPLNIVYNKKDQMFGVTSNLDNRVTNYTSFRGGSNSFMLSSGQQLTLSQMMDRDMNMTNYENALELGKIGLSLYDPQSYQKSSKTPRIYYNSPRAGPIKLNNPPPPAKKSDLPLVDTIGSFASKRRWDEKGAFRIDLQTSPRFASDSYLGEKPFLKDKPQPTSLPDANRTFNRSPAHIFPGLKKKLDPSYLENKEELFKKIIKGKERVDTMRDFIKQRRIASEPPVKRKKKVEGPDDWLKYHLK